MRGQHDQPWLPEEDGADARVPRTLPAPPDGRVVNPVSDRSSRLERRAGDHPGSVAEHLRERLGRLPAGHPSSPYDSNGTLRPPLPDHRQLEQPMLAGEGYGRPAPNTPESLLEPDEEQPALPSERTDHPISVEEVQEPERRAIDTWRQEIGHLRDVWRNHEEEWPASKRPPVDRSHDEPGSWRGDSGHYLNAEENLVSDHALERISEIEKKTTPTLLDITAEVPSADLVGLQFKLKGEGRFKEKIGEESRAKPERSIGEIAERMPDALRYTCQIDAVHYLEGYWRSRELLQQKGNELILSRNSWDDPEYRGVNTRWLSPQGQVFEVQFHTPESYQAKELTHKAYERLRSKVTSDAERPLLEAFQRDVSAYIPMPSRVEEIPDYRKEGY